MGDGSFSSMWWIAISAMTFGVIGFKYNKLPFFSTAEVPTAEEAWLFQINELYSPIASAVESAQARQRYRERFQKIEDIRSANAEDRAPDCFDELTFSERFGIYMSDAGRHPWYGFIVTGMAYCAYLFVKYTFVYVLKYSLPFVIIAFLFAAVAFSLLFYELARDFNAEHVRQLREQQLKRQENYDQRVLEKVEREISESNASNNSGTANNANIVNGQSMKNSNNNSSFDKNANSSKNNNSAATGNERRLTRRELRQLQRRQKDKPLQEVSQS